MVSVAPFTSFHPCMLPDMGTASWLVDAVGMKNRRAQLPLMGRIAGVDGTIIARRTGACRSAWTVTPQLRARVGYDMADACVLAAPRGGSMNRAPLNRPALRPHRNCAEWKA